MIECPECGSEDIDVTREGGIALECQECGFTGEWDDFDYDEEG